MLLPSTAIAEPKPAQLDVYTDFSAIKIPDPLPKSILCNCYAYVKSQFENLPFPGTILNNLQDQGNVAVFYYQKSGLYHYAVVVNDVDGYLFIKETNYLPCEQGNRKINKKDPNLLGFFTI